MTEPCPAPSSGDDTDVEPSHSPPAGTSRWQMVIGGIGLAVVVWVGSETYAVISATDTGGPGPGGIHGPGQDTPDEPGDEIDPEDDDVHDPSQFDHG